MKHRRMRDRVCQFCLANMGVDGPLPHGWSQDLVTGEGRRAPRVAVLTCNAEPCQAKRERMVMYYGQS